MKKFDHFVKTKSKMEEVLLDEETIRLFSKIMGQSDLLVESLNQLPTFFTRFRAGEFKFFEEMGVMLQDLLHGEQEYEYLKEIKVGSTVFYQTTLLSAPQKLIKDQMMTFFQLETKVSADKNFNEILGLCKSTIIFREKISHG